MIGSREGDESPEEPALSLSNGSLSESPLATARMIVGALAAGLLLLAVVSEWIPRFGSAGFLVGPAGILGIVSPAIGYRLFHLLRDKVPPDAGAAAGQVHFVRASVLALAVTATAGALGILVFALTGELTTLIGVASHMILTGVLWPTDDRLAAFLSNAAPPSRPEG